MWGNDGGIAMKLNPPKKVVFWIALCLGVVAILLYLASVFAILAGPLLH